MLDAETGACLIYNARPVACRSYGFYVERQNVLGCYRVEAIAEQSAEVVWGNHVSLEEKLAVLGPAFALPVWLAADDASEGV
jgi:uncharacterized protein